LLPDVNDDADAPRVLLISGSTRSLSTNTALCRTAVQCAPAGVVVQCYLDLAVLPHFNPDDDHDPLPPDVAALRAAVGSAHAVLFCTPEYAGTVPGSLKNLLDWTVGGTEFTAKPVAWVKVAADARRGEGAHGTLAIVLGYVQARIIDTACRHIPVRHDAVGPDGLITDSVARTQIASTIQALADIANSA
jgi:chromate reductase